MSSVNPTGKHRRKRRHHGEGTVVHRTDHWRALPWVAVVPYRDASGRRREKWLSAASREEADKLRRDELDRLRSGTVTTNHTVGSYVWGWLADRDLRPSTHDRYRNHIAERIIPTLGSMPLADLTPPRVRAAMREWSGSPATRNGTVIVLRQAMRQAVTDRMVAGDPMAGVKAPTVKAPVPTVLDVGEWSRLREAIRGERIEPIVIVAIGLGLRRGEVLGLSPDAIRGDTVVIERQLRRIPPAFRGEGEDAMRLVAPKADSGRTLEMPGFVREAIDARLVEREAEKRPTKLWAANDLLFCDRVGNPIALTTLDRWFKAALVKAGLPDMRFHELRHSTGTILLAEGVPERVVQAILGHKSAEMTSRYMSVLSRTSRDAADRLDDAMGG